MKLYQESKNQRAYTLLYGLASTFVWILSFWTTANGGTNALAGSLSGISLVYGTGYDEWIFYGPYAFVDSLHNIWLVFWATVDPPQPVASDDF